ncbi:MAG: hypothetical protein WBC88_08690 [Candidatus Zixiibacteriota bacterium]
MSTYAKQMQRIAGKYMQEHHVEYINPRDVADWAIRRGLWQPERSALLRQFTEILSRALREEYITDPQGRRVRSKHAIVEEKDGEQTSLWGDIRTANRKHMALSFQQRRRQIFGDCRQLKTDVDSYNGNYNRAEPIQMSFNFSDDLEEAESGATIRRSSASAHSRLSSQSPASA